MRLVKASLEPPKGLLDFIREIGEGENGFTGEPDLISGRLDLPAYLRKLVDMDAGIGLPDGWVPSSTFWLIDQDETVAGMSRLRHRLTPRLLAEGGHIGYYVRRDKRNRRNGTLLLALTLEEARSLGIERVLLTPLTDNMPSCRLIETNGGVVEDERIHSDGSSYRRYWIELAV